MLGMRPIARHVAIVCTVLFIAVGGCSDDDPQAPCEEMVTIAGTVLNIDTGTPARGVRVSLFEQPYADVAPSGSDGRFQLQVPKGSTLLLQTDDFDASADSLIALINVDVPLVKANGDILGWVTHACPNSSGQPFGSVACWDNYLAGADDTNGDCFEPRSTADSPGVVSVVFAGCVNGNQVLLPDMNYEVTEPECPEAYVDITKKFILTKDATSGPEMFYPCTQDRTDANGWTATFCDTAFAGTNVTVTYTDMDATRTLNFATPITVPVRPGALTVMWGLMIDGVPNKNIAEVLQCVNAP